MTRKRMTQRRTTSRRTKRKRSRCAMAGIRLANWRWTMAAAVVLCAAGVVRWADDKPKSAAPAAAADQDRPAAKDDGVYEYRPGSPDGIGKWYMGREIAHVMGHQAADWLER